MLDILLRVRNTVCEKNRCILCPHEVYNPVGETDIKSMAMERKRQLEIVLSALKESIEIREWYGNIIRSWGSAEKACDCILKSFVKLHDVKSYCPLNHALKLFVFKNKIKLFVFY